MKVVKAKMSGQEKNKIVRALNTLELWFNTTSGDALAKKVYPAALLLRTIVPYVPHRGGLYRSLNINGDAPAEGTEVVFNTGLRPLQSWTGQEKMARSFLHYLGNTKNRVMVRLLSEPKEEVLNMPWLRKVIGRLKSDLLESPDEQLSTAISDLVKTIRPRGHRDDEDEVLLMLPEHPKVLIVQAFSKRVRSN